MTARIQRKRNHFSAGSNPFFAAMISILLVGSVFCESGHGPGLNMDLGFKITNDLEFTAPLLTSNDAVMEWNQYAVTRVLSAGLPAPRQLRAMAIVHVSVHDAVNGLTREYETYLPAAAAPENASVEGAAIGAAYRALVGLFGSSAQLDSLFLSSLQARNISETDAGVMYGVQAAANIVALRSGDGNAQAACAYTDPTNPPPGAWVRIINPATGTYPAASLPCFGNVTPWVLHSGSQFRPDAPPDLLSERYARDYNEVLALGAIDSSTRTPEQTQIAMFWNGSPAAIWNQVLRQAADAQEMSLSAKARAFGLVYMTSTDTSIACWDAKYFYQTWRPETAIARALEDGNPETNPQTGWRSLLPTWLAQHPEYLSGHAVNSSGLASAMTHIFGNEPGITLTPTIAGIQREWTSFSQGIDEVIDARVYSGLHFRFTDETSARVGRQVAQFVYTHALRPCKRSRSRCS